jgi:antitoxin CcdA
MRMAARAPKQRRATNVSLPTDLIEEARRLKINISQACEAGLDQEVRKSLREAWIAENMDAMKAMNAWVEEHGLPLAKYRQF